MRGPPVTRGTDPCNAPSPSPHNPLRHIKRRARLHRAHIFSLTHAARPARVFVGRSAGAPFVFDAEPVVTPCNLRWLAWGTVREKEYLAEIGMKAGAVGLGAGREADANVMGKGEDGGRAWGGDGAGHARKRKGLSEAVLVDTNGKERRRGRAGLHTAVHRIVVDLTADSNSDGGV